MCNWRLINESDASGYTSMLCLLVCALTFIPYACNVSLYTQVRHTSPPLPPSFMIHGCVNKSSNAVRKQEGERKARCRQYLGREGEGEREGAGERDEKVRKEGGAMLA